MKGPKGLMKPDRARRGGNSHDDEQDVGHVELLQIFLNGLYELLHDVIEKGTDYQGQPIFHEEFLVPMREAFEELGYHFRRLHGAIPETPEERILDHALDGRQLSFKLRVVRFYADRFRAIGGAGLFRKLLETLEGLLDSIIDAAGTGGAIKEFKEFVKNSTTEERFRNSARII